MKLTDSIITAARQVDTIAGGLEAILLALTSRAAGWIACIPTILLTSRSCEVIFNLTPMEALASAVALELVGQSTTKTWLRAREWNRAKRVSDAPASASLALVLTVGYFVIDFALIAILQVPKAQAEPIYYAALLFPLAQVISTVTTAERAAQFGREAVAEADREKRRKARQSAIVRRSTSQVAPQAAIAGNGNLHHCPHCGASAGKDGKPFANSQAVSAHLRQCKTYRAQKREREARLMPVISGNGGNA